MQEIRQCYISKHDKIRNTLANLLMITEGHGKWHYVAIKIISGLLRGITSTHNGDFYCLNCFHSYRTQKKLKEHEQLCGKHNFCNLKLPDEEHKYISSTSGQNILKNPFIIYVDLEGLLFSMDSWENTKNNSFTECKSLHIPSGFSILTCYSFDKSQNKQIYYRGKDCMQKFSLHLGNIFVKQINYQQKPMLTFNR